MVARGVLRAVVAGVVAVAVGLSLGGCSLLPRGGQTASHAQSVAAEIPGVVSAEVDSGGSYSGFNYRSSTRVDLVLADEYEVADADKLVWWAVTTGWSVNDHEPNDGVVLSLLHLDGTEVEWDWEAAVDRFGFDPDTVKVDFLSGRENLAYWFDFGELEPLLGGWPGAAPETSEGIFERVGDTVDVAP